MAVRFGSVRVTWRFGSVRFVLCSVAGREVFDRMGVDEYQIVIWYTTVVVVIATVIVIVAAVVV